MLPGFRFLFTAIVLSMSVLIFGLGAAALLRAAHEEFANLPSRRATPEPMFARLNDDPPPTLALLRIDPPVAEQAVRSRGECSGNSRRYPGTGRSNPGRPSGRAGETGGADAGRADASRSGKAGSPGEGGTRRHRPLRPLRGRNRCARGQCGSEDRRHRGNAGTGRGHSACNSPEPAADIPPFEGSIATTLIATLGGPAVLIDETTSTTEAKPDRSAVKKRAAERARERRRMAAHGARAWHVRPR